MLKCEKCGVEILCKTDVCPLCHERLDTSEENKTLIARSERAFPSADPKRGHLKSRFSVIYAIASFIVLLVLVPLNLLFGDQPWILIAAAFLLYFYFLIRSTLLNSKAFHSRILGQAVSLTAISLLVDVIFDNTLWVYEYVVPVICFACLIILCVYVLLNLNNATRYMLTITVTAVIGLIPIPVLLIFRDAHPVLWPSIVTATFSVALIVVSLAIAGKRMLADLRRLLHLK